MTREAILIPFLFAFGYSASNASPILFDSTPENISGIAGTTAILPCTADLTDADSKREITWMSPREVLIAIGDRRIIDDTRMSIERPRVPDWNLHIRELQFYDRGTYTCSLNTKPMSMKKIHLEVYVEPQIYEKTRNTHQILKEGATANLTCNATGYPEPTITWYRKSISEKEAISQQGAFLMIHNITRYCSGAYECEAFNGIGPAVSKVFSVNVHFQPEVQVLNKKQKQDLGKETILQCEISASPQAIVNWRKGEDVFTANSFHRITSEIYEKDIYTTILLLRIQNLTWNDFGEYVCEASNILGRDLERMQLFPINGIQVSPKAAKDDKSDSKTIIFDFSSSSTSHQKSAPSPGEQILVKSPNSKPYGIVHDSSNSSSEADAMFHIFECLFLIVLVLICQMISSSC